ncbi:MAG: alpha-amylase/alpha-mannosidase (GH57 family) [Planctomycetota bacterium]|jgi:alpha-amylase/alpha-mannosidase (GH57 family)
MENDKQLKVVLCWHMHQPDYRDHIRDEFQLPWVYLHAIKDYVDMAAHLEAIPEAKAVINFSPILLEQLQVYETQIHGRLNNSDPIRDPLLTMLDAPVFPSAIEYRTALVKACLRSNRKQCIERYSAYQQLAEIAESVINGKISGSYLSNQYLADLVTWYHLAWLGETVKRTDTLVMQLIEQASGFTLHQRHGLLEVVGRCISSLRSRYTKLAKEGQVELSMSPYAHPMSPLLSQFDVAREVMPKISLPMLNGYPGGNERARWHLEHGLSVFENYFGMRPVGCWPSEGGISTETLKLISESGFKWAATGENVLRNSLNQSTEKNIEKENIYKIYHEQDSNLCLFARDDNLSDKIGFTYFNWHGDDAVADLIHQLEHIADTSPEKGETVVSIIMDGENAWEHYPENGYYFLSALYQKLSAHPGLQLTTYNTLTDSHQVHELGKVVSGSWVYGSFSTWIGDEDKNRAWDILGDAKRVYDEVCSNTSFDEKHQERIDKQLAVCEGSDWFWWFGDYNPADAVSDFERLYRIHLANLYQMLGQEPPQYLAQILAHGSGSPEMGGVIRHGAVDQTN